MQAYRARSSPTSTSPPSWLGVSTAPRSRRTASTPARWPPATAATATPAGLLAFGLKISAPFFLTPEKGARTSIYLASSPDVSGVSGKYFIKCKPRLPSKAAQDDRAAKRLWQISEELVDRAGEGTTG